ncbi:sterol desaturase family protein [Thermococcus nautili]|uniref:ABC-type multidrug transport system, permease component n=1 Tax=Thermococcus nautili TaxID=195522 RepID=W8NUF7_9EURY|nr:multidrug transporter [Thermococcus nautili]AHL22908.1 ABC-type multidrug transport system, permease component [Thermococcus nautili]CAI1492988.1 ABC-type multidrug transport system, permease component [Thermococcus nautili]
MVAIVEYYARALTRGRFSLLSFALQPLSFIFIVYVVSGGRFLNTALAGALVSFVVGVGIADLAIELVGMKTRSRFYDIIMSLPGSNWRKALGISIGMSVPALPYVVLLTAILVWRLGVWAFPRMLAAIAALWLWSAGIGFLLGVKGKEPIRVMRLSNLLVAGLTVFPPVYYPASVLPGWLAKILVFLPTVSASQVLSGTGGRASLITTFLWGVLGLAFLLRFAGIEE